VVEVRQSFLRRNRWLAWVAGVLFLTLAALAIVAVFLVRRVEPFLRAQLVATLSQRFSARVELDRFHVSLLHGLDAEGEGLRIWPPSQAAGAEPASNGDPLIRLDRFRFRAPLHFRGGQPIRIRSVELSGLTLHIPPKWRLEHPSPQAADAPPATAAPRWLSFAVDSVQCSGVELLLETGKPEKLPVAFEIPQLTLTGITPEGAMHFEADLTNPLPRGPVHSTGTFGPWQVSDPGESPVSGDYRLENADLASIKGIAGILTSTGHYQGTLRALVVDGEAGTPDFRLTNFGNSLPLHTRFHARVDGTDGDTWLDSVDATLGHSHFTAQGPIVRIAPEPGDALRPGGHDIALSVNVDRARVEDFLFLAGKSPTPLLTGDVTAKAELHIPPGVEPVHRRLRIDGVCHLDRVRFTSAKIQDGLRQLSLRGQGRPDDIKTTDAENIESAMDGKFQVADAVIVLPQLSYNVPGAQIELKGKYGLEGGTLDFAGTAKMQATVSQMVGGWKGFLLKPADRFFKKDGAGTEIAVHLEGTRENPDFGIDFGHTKSTSPEKPGANQQ
jgi:hypothetical protein